MKVQRFKRHYPYDWKTGEPIIVTGATSQWFANLDGVLDHPSKSVTLADDRRINEDTNGAGMCPPLIDASMLGPSGPGDLQDLGINHIQSGRECQSVDADMVSMSSVQISNESSKVHIQRQSA